jgi:3-hydroxybutyryl-CoA dehydrogenase
MGPLALMDLIGLDTAYEILETMHRQSRDRLHAPAPLLKQLVTAGLLGRKTGRGFYRYAAPGSATVDPDPASGGRRSGGMPRPVSRIAVVGRGATARAITEACTSAGYQLVLLDDLEDVGASLVDVDFAFEAGETEVPTTRQLFATLDRMCKPGAVIATTTSQVPIIECAAATARPHDVVGVHFFHPADDIPVVEVVGTVTTDDDVVATAWDVAERIGKQPVLCGDRVGFIVDALLFPYLNDAVKLLDAHYASADDIDAAMTLGCGYPVGPFDLLDEIGLDRALSLQRRLYLESREPGLAPAPLLEQLVTAGYLGRKSGRGFRDQSQP